MPVRARVASTAVNGNALEAQDANHLLGFVNQFSRPLLGSGKAGFHYWPDAAAPNPGAPAAPGDEVIVLCEQRGWQHGSVSYARPQDMPTGNGGESAMLHRDGRVAVRLLNSGVTQALRDPNFGNTGIAGQTGTITVTGSVAATLNAPTVTLTGTNIGATASNNLTLNGALSTLFGTSLTSVNSGGNVTMAGNSGVQISSANGAVSIVGSGPGAAGGVSIGNPLVLTNQTTAGNFTLNGTALVSGTDPQGGTVISSGTCQVGFAHTLTITVNGVSYQLPSLT